MSLISSSRHSKLQQSARSAYIERKLSPSLHRTKQELREQAYLDHLNEVYRKNWSQMKHNNDKIVSLKMEKERLRTVMEGQTQQLSSSVCLLLKEQFTLQMERLSRQIIDLHQLRQKQDEALTKSNQTYVSSYQKEVNNNLKLQNTVQKGQVQLQLYRNILESKRVAVKLLESKIISNRQKINLKMQCQNKYKEVMSSKMFTQ